MDYDQEGRDMFLSLDTQPADKLAAKDSEGNFLTYGQLVDEVEGFAAVDARTVAFILCTNTAGSLVGYLSLVERDVVPLMLSAKIDPDLLSALLDAYEPRYLWVPEGLALKAEERTEGKVVFSRLGYTLLDTGSEPYPMSDQLQLLMTTSGSTGSPKLVRYKRGNLEANARNVARAFGWTAAERPVCDLGMQYTMGLNVINTHLYAGATVLLTTHNLMSSGFWDYIRAEKATNFTGVPFSYDIFHRLRFERMDLPDLITLSQGGGRLTEERFQQLAAYANRTGKRFIASFGTTETAARLSLLPPEYALTKTCSIGKAIPEGELFLVDGEGHRIYDAVAEGEICYRGPNVTMGYALNREDLARGDDFAGEYRTGDLARRDEDGFYYVTGRLSRFLKLLSYRVSLDQCERMVSERFGVECACAGTDERMGVFVVGEVDAAEVRDFLAGKLNIYKSMFKVVPMDALPRNDTGKVKYRELVL